jgi:hypothetical protein
MSYIQEPYRKRGIDKSYSSENHGLAEVLYISQSECSPRGSVFRLSCSFPPSTRCWYAIIALIDHASSLLAYRGGGKAFPCHT